MNEIALPQQNLPPADQFLYWPPQFQVCGYRMLDQLFATRPVLRGERVALLPRGLALTALHYDSGGRSRTIDEFMLHNVVAGLLVIKDGQIRLERYGLGLRDADRWSTMSTVKSISAMLLGAAVQDGAIDSIDRSIEHYLPQLRGSGYQGVSIRHLLTMTACVNWSEDYADPQSDVNRYSASLAHQVPGGVMAQLQKVRRTAEPGSRWQYNTGNSYLLGCVLRAAIGEPLADYLSRKFWQPLGMEFDAFYTLENDGGQEIAGSRAGMALRDIGRFAKFVLDDGIIDDTRVLPPGWVDAALSPAYRFTDDEEAFGPIRANRLIGYGYSWWIDRDGAAVAIGFAGQRIYINRREQLAIVTLSAFPQAPHVPLPLPDREHEVVLLTNAIRQSLSE
jgi:CubicO group peptidase (beta-lactamase class C family)